ncbi:MAG: S-layer homology domain-containing protein [Clostridia bacterium]|nr:S-layer homology domain-containing protein [Clostridia bacterium]
MKRLLSLVLAALFVAAAVPALAVPAAAKSEKWVDYGEGLLLAFYGDEEREIHLLDDIDYHLDRLIGGSNDCIEVTGKKTLDLNGHGITVHLDAHQTTSALFRLGSGADMTVKDSKGGGFIRYNGPIDENGTFRERTIFIAYSGSKLTVESGQIEAGRSKSHVGMRDGKLVTIWKETVGKAIDVRGGEVTVNGGTLIGRGENFGAVSVYGKGKLRINGGIFLGKGGAACVDSRSTENDIRISAGEFSTSSLDNVYMQGDFSNLTPSDAGVRRDMLTPGAVADPDDGDLSGLKRLTVAPGFMGMTISPGAGKKTTMNDGTVVWRIGTSDPTVKVDAASLTPYYEVTDDEAAGHGFVYRWSVRCGGEPVADEVTTETPGVNLFTDFGGFFPIPGETYSVRCESDETIKGGSSFKRYSQDMKFTLVQSDEIPAILDGPDPVIEYANGETKNLCVSTSGTGVSYTWQKSDDPGSGVWTTIAGQVSWQLQLRNLGPSDDGAYYRCIVSNYAGTVYTEPCRLSMKQGVVTRIDLAGFTAPIADEPLCYDVVAKTPGCAVAGVEWEEAGGETLGEGYRPYPGQSLTVSITVENDADVTVPGSARAYLLDKSAGYPGNPYENAHTYRFTFKAKSVKGAQRIKTASFAVEPPLPGKALGEATAVDSGFGDLYTNDARFTVEERKWTENGNRLPSGHVAEQGHDYALILTLKATEGWYFKYTVADLNGENMYTEEHDGKLDVFFIFPGVDAPEEAARPNPFVDVPESEYYYEPVMWAVYHDPVITVGTDATHFSPNDTCTRGQIVTFLWRANGCPEPSGSVASMPFYDVKPDDYFAKAVLWAKENGITSGADATHFSPNAGCTRAQVVTFLWRSFGEPDPGTASNPFSDVPHEYYYDAVLWAVANGITAGTSPTAFSPNATCTRAQIVTFLFRAYNK